MSTLQPELDRSEADTTAFVVLDADDRILRVGPGLHDRFGAFVGQVLWGRLPGAEPLYGPHFEEARETCRTVEFTVYYAAELKRIRATPGAEDLTIHIWPIGVLDVRTLATLAESLQTMELELSDRASEPPGRPAPASPRAPL